MYVRIGRPAFARPYVGVHKSTTLMSSFLPLQQCPACLVRLTWIVFVMEGRWPYSWCRFIRVHVVHPYSSIEATAAWKKLRFILSVRSLSLNTRKHVTVCKVLETSTENFPEWLCKVCVFELEEIYQEILYNWNNLRDPKNGSHKTKCYYHKNASNPWYIQDFLSVVLIAYQSSWVISCQIHPSRKILVILFNPYLRGQDERTNWL